MTSHDGTISELSFGRLRSFSLWSYVLLSLAHRSSDFAEANPKKSSARASHTDASHARKPRASDGQAFTTSWLKNYIWK